MSAEGACGAAPPGVRSTDLSETEALRAQVASLTRRAAREKAARQQAESIGEQATAALYGVVRQLQRSRSLVDRTTDLVLMMDEAGRVTYANAAARGRLASPDALTGDLHHDRLQAQEDDDEAGPLAGVRACELLTEDAWLLWVSEVAPRASAAGVWHGDLQLVGGAGRSIAASAVVLAHPASATAAAGWSVIARDVTAERELQQQLQHRADHDALTGLGNRTSFFTALESALDDLLGVAARLPPARTTDRAEEVLGVLFIDLDGFKAVNDTRGHEVGDRLLQLVADELRGCLRQGDVACRLGGDEFTAVLPHLAHPADAEAVADRIIAALTSPSLDGQVLPTSASVGVATCVRARAADPDRALDGRTAPVLGAAELVRRADAAMYAAKRSGRGRCVVAGPLVLTGGARPAAVGPG